MLNKPILLITNNFDPATIEKLEAIYDVHKLWLLKEKTERQLLLAQIAPDCQAVATAGRANAELINALPKLKMIANFGVGVDGIDFSVTNARNIKVSNTPDVLNDEVADLALALIFASQRQLVIADNFVRNKQWLNGPMPFGRGVAGKTLGIMGLGRIGEAIADRALACKMNIAYHNRQQKNVPYLYCDSFLALAKQSDILVNVLPSTPDTAKIVDEQILKALGSEGTFINIGRGDTVDQVALINALKNKVIAKAGLDVYVNEPNVPEELMALPNVVLTPHIGSATYETRAAMGQLVVDNLAAFFANKPLVTSV